MVTRAGLCFLLSMSGLLALTPMASGLTTAKSTPFADRKQLALDGSNDAADDDFEFDLDVSSKKKLKRLHQQLHQEEEEEEEAEDEAEGSVEVAVSGEGATSKWSAPLDYSTKVTPLGFNYGRGTRYVAAQQIFEGDVLFSVPFVDVLNLHSARQGRVRALLDANADLPASIALAIHLLEERFRGESSRFHDYIETLPTSSAGLNSTLFYNEEDMAMLQGSHLQRVTVGRAQAISNFFDALVGPVTSLALDPPLFTKDEFTKENFAWAMGTVWARAYSLADDDENAMLAPILDTIGVCIDAACSPSRVVWDRELQRVVVYATRDYATGDEVVLSLGDHKPSTLLMLNHGFARPQPFTEAETFDLSIFLDPNDTLIDVKTHMLASHNMSIESSYTLRYKSKQLDVDMVRSLKFKLLSAAELDKYAMLLGPLPSGVSDEMPIVSLRNEYVFTRAVVFACKNLLANYATTIEHDRVKLQEVETRYRDRRVGVADKKIQMLRALVIEKEILHHAMGFALAHWNELLTLAEPTFLEK